MIYKGSGVFRSYGCRALVCDHNFACMRCTMRRLCIDTFLNHSMQSTSEHCSNVLLAAWGHSRQHSPEKTHKDLVTAVQQAFQGLEPYNWQLDVAEALILGLYVLSYQVPALEKHNVICIAAAGG